MTERFNRAFNALLNAFFEGSLTAGNCGKCAVGNIVADCQSQYKSLEVKDKYHLNDSGFWGDLFVTTVMDGKDAFQEKNPHGYEKDHLKKAKKALKVLTGYKAKELAKVEFAFESNAYNYSENDSYQDQDLKSQFNGLKAVTKVLLELDEIEDPTCSYVKRFTEHPGFTEDVRKTLNLT